MRILRHAETVPEECRGGVAALGNFDGFHRGHQAVLGQASQEAARFGVPLVVVTQEPHPRAHFKPDGEPFRLTPFRAKASAMERFGVDVLVALPFGDALAATLAQDFVMGVVLGGLHARHVVVGYDYRFGRGRGGGTDVLRRMGEMEGFGVTIVEPKGDNGEIHSSTAVRNCLKSGDPYRAATLLGRWWRIEGHVLHGDKRGRTLGFPTINLDLSDYLRPAFGVYAVRAEIEDGPKKGLYEGVANLGMRPTVGGERPVLEVHLFDFEGDLYGRHAGVEVVQFIRPERKFAGLDTLRAQIAQDCEEARSLLAEPGFAASAFTPLTRRDFED